MRRALVPAALILLAAAGCSSSASTKPAVNSTASAPSTGSTGAPVAPPSSTPVKSAALGAPITQGSLNIVVSGTPTVARNGGGALATFQVSMTNTGSSDAVGPDFFGVRCDANRGDANPGDEMSTSTAAQDKQVAAGKRLDGTAVLAWLKWNAVTKCTGPTTIEAHFQDGTFLAWTLPQAVVDQVNAAAGA